MLCLRLTVFFYSGYQKRRHEIVGLPIVNFILNNTSIVTTIPLVHHPCSVPLVREVSAPRTVLNSTGVVLYSL
jgi:hypothetical protein